MKLRGHMGAGEGTSRCMVEGRCHASRVSAMDRQYIVAWQAWKSRLRADGAQLHDWGGWCKSALLSSWRQEFHLNDNIYFMMRKVEADEEM